MNGSWSTHSQVCFTATIDLYQICATNWYGYGIPVASQCCSNIPSGTRFLLVHPTSLFVGLKGRYLSTKLEHKYPQIPLETIFLGGSILHLLLPIHDVVRSMQKKNGSGRRLHPPNGKNMCFAMAVHGSLREPHRVKYQGQLTQNSPCCRGPPPQAFLPTKSHPFFQEIRPYA